MSYLRITVTTPAGNQLSYKSLDPKVHYSDDDLTQIARRVANSLPWLWEVVDDTGMVTDSGQGV